MTVQGVAIMVANFSNVGIGNLTFVPNTSVNDGELDIIVYKKADIESIMAWAKSTITQTKPDGSLTHIQAKKVYVSVNPTQTVMCDDTLIKDNTISLTISPKALQVLVPHG